MGGGGLTDSPTHFNGRRLRVVSEVSKVSKEDSICAYKFHSAIMEGMLQLIASLVDAMVLHSEVGFCEGLF